MQNTTSARLLDRLGMTREGVLRRHICIMGVHYDMEILYILREEWNC